MTVATPAISTTADVGVMMTVAAETTTGTAIMTGTVVTVATGMMIGGIEDQFMLSSSSLSCLPLSPVMLLSP